MSLKADSILFLLGAGASKEAGIPISTEMIERVENKLNTDWHIYRALYYCIKSSIMNRFGMIGDFDSSKINIETIVNTMDELIKSIDHPIYPFVGSWIPRLTELTNNNFHIIKELREKIVAELYNWMRFEQNEKIAYFMGFLKFQNEYKRILRIFTLNYDTCVEDSCADAGINRGFDTTTHIWDWRNFENEEKSTDNIFLYKLHGSKDWAMDSNNIVKERMNEIGQDERALIFGTTYKMQYLDPFLFLINEFRRRTLDPKTEAIICIGYSFGDEHINGIIKQSLTNNPDKKVIVVSPLGDVLLNDKVEQIRTCLGINSTINIKYLPYSAKKFLEEELSTELIESLLPDEEIPF